MVFNCDKMHLDGHNDDLFKFSIALNKIRNVLITPATYLFGGKTVTCYRFKIEDPQAQSKASIALYSDLNDSYPQNQKNIFKTLLAITCLVPSVFAYLIACPLTMLYSDELHRKWSNFQEYKKDPYAYSKCSTKNSNIVNESPLFVKIKDRIRVAIWHQDEEKLNKILEKIDLNNRRAFFDYYNSLPIAKKAAPMQGKPINTWYSLSDKAFSQKPIYFRHTYFFNPHSFANLINLSFEHS